MKSNSLGGERDEYVSKEIKLQVQINVSLL